LIPTLSILPLSFWAVMIVLGLGGAYAWRRIRDGSGIPMLVVLGTVGVWYVGDAFYNDYAEHHAKLFDSQTLQSAWWQVAWFVVVFLAAAPWIHRQINARHIRQGSGALRMYDWGVGQREFQKQLNALFYGCVLTWIVLAVVAAIRIRGDVLHFLFPFLGYKAEPWGRQRIGSGFSALLTFAMYIQLLVTSIFGVVAALATERRTRRMAVIFCLLAMPYFVFDRTRNTMLAAVIPGILSWGVLRIRGGLWKKAIALAGCFVVVNAWMAFVISNRSGMSIAAAINEKGFHLSDEEKVHHEGLNMFEELCWINNFIERGTYTPNWGSRYFAEIVNFIPRSLWPGKPLIGIDYAIARGQGGGSAGSAGVYATMSTGMIGQGVVNFGRILGPMAAALIMSFWVAALARLDLHMQELGRMPLYASGLILTFNLGRDITLITLYPFVFGWIALWLVDRYHLNPQERRIPSSGAARANERDNTKPIRHRPAFAPGFGMPLHRRSRLPFSRPRSRAGGSTTLNFNRSKRR
jgi:hypothetical protein